jgi:ABC-type nitrate/sulfonate/bicarbonate transport system substrate-binding protein
MAPRKGNLITIAAFIMAALIAAPAASQQGNPAKLHLIWFVPNPVVTIAKARGLFAAEGLELQITQTGSSTQQMRGLSQGTYDIAGTAFDNVLAWSGKEGADIVTVAQMVDGVILPLLVRPEIKAWSDLRGKKLAVDAVDTAYALVLRRILLVNGLDLRRGDFELVAAGAPAQRIESMKRGDTYAGIINIPADVQAKVAGLIPFAYQTEFLNDYPGTVLAVTRAWAQGHRKELVGFLRAWRSALRWARDPANREAAINAIVGEAKISPASASLLFSLIPKDGFLSLSGAKTVLDIRSEFAAPPVKGPSIEAYVDLSYFQEASPQ